MTLFSRRKLRTKVRVKYMLFSVCYCHQLGTFSVRLLRRTGVGFSVQGSTSAALGVGNRVRRVGLFHICTDKCVVDVGCSRVQHRDSMLAGGRYRVAGRYEGYPPYFG